MHRLLVAPMKDAKQDNPHTDGQLQGFSLRVDSFLSLHRIYV